MTTIRLPFPLLGLMALLALSACGGGGGGGGGSTAPPPAPPPPPDSEPDAFAIQATGDAARGSAVVSQAVAIQGINVPANVSIVGGEYSVNGGAFTSATGTVANAQSIVVRVTAATAPGGAAEATLTVGSVAARFTVTTSSDVTPPTSNVVFPTARSRTSSEQLIVRGTASDTESPVISVRVNGVEATSTDNFATWTATAPLALGANTIVVDALDRAQNRSAATPRAEITRNALIGFIERFAVDAAGGRVIAGDSFAGVVLSIDLTTGLRTVLSKNTVPLAAMALDQLRVPGSVSLEASGTHALVLDRGNAAILRVDLATGARTVVSGRGIPNTQNELANPMAMSANLAAGRAYVLGRMPDAIYSIDLATGARTVLSNATTPNAADMFPNPTTMALDSARNRLLVADQGLPGGGTNHAIYTVSLADGARGILSNDVVPNSNNPFEFIGGIGVDGAWNRALVLQPFTGSILAVDLLTGARTVFSSPVLPNTANALEHARAIALDPGNGRALVADSGTRSLVAVNLDTGARTLVSPNEPADIGARQRYSTGVALDLGANRIYVTDPLSQALNSVNLATGDRTVVSSSTMPFGPAWMFPNAVAIDAPNNRFLVVDLQGQAVYAVAFGTGARTVLSGNASQSGVSLDMPQTLAIDRDRNRALVTDFGLNALVAVSLTDGARAVLSGPAVPDSGQPFVYPYGVVADVAGNRALVASNSSVVAVDFATGARSVLSTGGNTGTWLPYGIGIDASTRTIVTGDLAISAMHVIDPVSGARALASNEAVPRSNDVLKPRGVAVDGARRIAWVTNDHFAILQVVDLVTGERVFLTR